MRRGGKGFLHGPERFLRLPSDGGQAHLPIVDLASVFPPIVSKTVNDSARQARAKGLLDLPLQHFAFAVFAFAQGIDAEFAEHKRLGLGKHLEPGEIIAEGLLVMEVDIEAEEVGAAGAKKFRGWIASESAKALGVGAFGDGDEVVEKVGNGFGSAPANDVGRDFIGDAEGKNGGMPSAGLNSPADGFASLGAVFR